MEEIEYVENEKLEILSFTIDEYLKFPIADMNLNPPKNNGTYQFSTDLYKIKHTGIAAVLIVEDEPTGEQSILLKTIKIKDHKSIKLTNENDIE